MCRHWLTLAAATAVLVAVASLFHRPAPAAADWVWCWDDPTLTVNGRVVHLNTGVPTDHRQVIESVVLTVTVPAGVTANLSGVNAAQGTGSLRTTTVLQYAGTYSGSGPIPVQVTATVIGPPGVPTQLTAWQASVGDRGQTAATMGMTMTLVFTLP
jgi:hypothetical protein